MAKCAICSRKDAISYRLGDHPSMMLCPYCVDKAQRKAVIRRELEDPPYRPSMRPKWMQ